MALHPCPWRVVGVRPGFPDQKQARLDGALRCLCKNIQRKKSYLVFKARFTRTHTFVLSLPFLFSSLWLCCQITCSTNFESLISHDFPSHQQSGPGSVQQILANYKYRGRCYCGFDIPSPLEILHHKALTCFRVEQHFPLLLLPTTYQGDGCHFLQRYDKGAHWNKEIKRDNYRDSTASTCVSIGDVRIFSVTTNWGYCEASTKWITIGTPMHTIRRDQQRPRPRTRHTITRCTTACPLSDHRPRLTFTIEPAVVSHTQPTRLGTIAKNNTAPKSTLVALE